MELPSGAGTVHERRVLPWLALITVYIVWGSTYLAIRVAVETLPPFLMAGIRYVIAGTILFPVAVLTGPRSSDRPGWKQWRAAAIVGALLMLGGNGLVSWAERKVASGIAALLVASIPLWMVLLDRAVHKARVNRRAVAGLVAGFLGVAFLARPSASQTIYMPGALAVLLASFFWANGSLYSRRAPLPKRTLLSASMQMLSGGVLLLIVATLRGEWTRLDPDAISLRSILGVIWLVVPGSLLAQTSYMYALRTLPTSIVGTYAFINPVIAVFLGAALLQERVTAALLAGGGLVVASVALVVSSRQRAYSAAGPPEAIE